MPIFDRVKARFQNAAIGHKLMIIAFVTALAVIIVTTVGYIVFEVHSFLAIEEEDRGSLAKIVGRSTVAAINQNDRASAENIIKALAEDADILSAWVILQNGEVFASYRRHPVTGILATMERDGRLFIAPDALSVKGGVLAAIRSGLKTVVPVVHKGERIGSIVIITDANELMGRLATYLGLVLCVFLGLAFFGYRTISRLQQLVIAPLGELSTTIDRVCSTRDYSLRVAYSGNDEIGVLAAGFNQLMQEMESHGEQVILYQDRLADMIALRTEELHRAKTEVETYLRGSLPDAGAEVSPPQAAAGDSGWGDDPSPRSWQGMLYSLMNCIDEEVWFIDEGDRALANRAAAGVICGDVAASLDGVASAMGYEIYRCNARGLNGVGSPLFSDLRRTSVRQMEIMLLGDDNTQHYQLINAEPFRSGGGEIAGTVFVVRDITLQKEAEEIKRFSAKRLLEAEEHLRKNLAAELHDEVGRDLTALHLNSEIINNSMPAGLREQLDERIEVVHGLLDELGFKVANIISELRPPLLDDFGLKTALKWLVETVAQRHGIAVELLVEDNFPRLKAEKEIAVFRIAQEAVNNAVKHAGTRMISVVLEEVGGHVRLMVVDDGRGFDPGVHRGSGQWHGWGMTIMRERAESVEGSFSLESLPGSGTTITVELERE